MDYHGPYTVEAEFTSETKEGRTFTAKNGRNGNMKVGFLITLGFAQPCIGKLAMARLVIDVGDMGKNLYYEEGTDKD